MSEESGGGLRSRLRVSPPWLVLLVTCALFLTAVDTFLIARSTGLFTGGFLVVNPRKSPGQFGAYLLESLVLDLTLVLGVWLLVLPILGRIRLGGWQKLAAAALCTLTPPLWFLYVRYHLSKYLGNALDPELWLAIGGGSPIEWFAQAHAQIIPVGLTLLASLAGAVLFVRVLRNRGARFLGAAPVPALMTLAASFGGTALLSAGILQGQCARPGAGCEALEKKASGNALVLLLERATDFDLDGYGMFAPLADRAPFDPTRHPFALDVPGDGIDQNDLAGDHPPDYTAPPDEFVEEPRFRRKPNVLVILLEGVRADIIGRELNGRRVTPVLDEILAQGSHSDHAYANSPYTARSRGQLLGGRLAPYKGQSTLIEDFHANGYDVAWISGQDESFGADESQTLGIGRTDYHFDAREDAKHSIAKYSTTGAIMISWKRVNRRVERYLEARKPDRPLFLYVNFGDTHFPYDHRELDDILGVRRLDVREVRPENARGVYETYANAMANVDRAIGELLRVWREKLGDDGAVVITSDHGEAIFETGVLGHGLALDATQTRVPLLVLGLGGTWPEPFGLTDLRGALQRSLAEAAGDTRPRARFEPVPGRAILQYMAVIERPRFLCLRTIDHELEYDTTQRMVPKDPAFASLIYWWESLQLVEDRRARGGG